METGKDDQEKITLCTSDDLLEFTFYMTHIKGSKKTRTLFTSVRFYEQQDSNIKERTLTFKEIVQLSANKKSVRFFQCLAKQLSCTEVIQFLEAPTYVICIPFLNFFLFLSLCALFC